MNTFKRIAGGLMLAGVVGLSACVPTPVHYPPLPVERIQSYYSEAAQTQAIDTSFYEVKDAEGNLLGTVLFSMPFTNDVKGFNGPTPLIIALDNEGRIMSVKMMDNQETPRFAERVAEGGLYEAWNGLTIEEAIGKEVDAISGATYTSTGVKNTLKTRLEVYQRQLAKERPEPSFWERLFTKS